MYLKEGEGAHEDSMGNKGILRAGDVQVRSTARPAVGVPC
jgi:redox-sensitive bicupin YhaK (pirin superfamily)